MENLTELHIIERTTGQCQNWDTLVDTGAEQRHSDANFPPARNPRITAQRRAVQIEKLIQFCGNVSGNTPSFLNI